MSWLTFFAYWSVGMAAAVLWHHAATLAEHIITAPTRSDP